MVADTEDLLEVLRPVANLSVRFTNTINSVQVQLQTSLTTSIDHCFDYSALVIGFNCELVDSISPTSLDFYLTSIEDRPGLI